MALSRNSAAPLSQPRRIGFVEQFCLFGWCHSVPSRSASLASNRSEVLVSRLLLRCCPTTITERVMAVVVDAVERMTRRWATAHVGQERLIRPAPLQADPNATPAVSCVSDVLGIVATGLHALPDFVLWRCLAPRAFAVSLVRATTAVFSLHAAAALGVSGHEVSGPCANRTSAVATTKPAAVFIAQRDQSNKALTGQITTKGHIVILTRGWNGAQ